MAFSNLSDMHRSQCRLLGPRTAVRFKRDGLYHDLSWTDYRWMADRAAAGLIELGVSPGDRVAMLAENRYEWMVADEAILSTGAADVPLHAPLAPRQVEYQVGHSQSRGIIVSGQQQADKVFQVLEVAAQSRVSDLVRSGRLTDREDPRAHVGRPDAARKPGE